ncbi:MAG: hypothetical protein ACLQJ0_30245 [Steroidobacteraceae bacterium]|jgi:hypothetical protein
MNTGGIPGRPKLVAAVRLVQRAQREPEFAKFAMRMQGAAMANWNFGAG